MLPRRPPRLFLLVSPFYGVFVCTLLTRSVKKRRAFRDMLVDLYLQSADGIGADVAAECLGVFYADASDDVEVTREDIRDELIRDPVATRMMVDDDTPEDVQRYLYLEALRRVRLRKMNLLDDSDNDLFAAPRSHGLSGSDSDSIDD